MAISRTGVKNLRELYLDEMVTIYLKGMNIVVTNEDAGSMDVTPMLQGIFMDVDMDFIHIGDGTTILKTIKHDDYGVIEISSPPMSMFDMDMPSSESEIN